MAEFPALMLWTDAWVADTGHLHFSARGIYMDLLILMWRTPGCQVPNDDDWLAHKLRLTPDEIEKTLRPIISEFCQTDGNWIRQKRLDKEHKRAKENFKVRSVRSKAMWDNKKNNPNRIQPQPHPQPQKKEEESRDSRRTEKVRRRAGTTIPPDWIPNETHFAQAYALGLPVDVMHAMADDMRLWAEANSNRAVARKADWDKTFSGWMRRNRKPIRNESFRDQQKQRAHDAYEQLKSHNRANREKCSREAPGLLPADSSERTEDFHRRTSGTLLQLLNPDNPSSDESNPRPARYVQIRSSNRRDP